MRDAVLVTADSVRRDFVDAMPFVDGHDVLIGSRLLAGYGKVFLNTVSAIDRPGTASVKASRTSVRTSA